MIKKFVALYKSSILSENKGTDALEYVAMAAIVVQAVAAAANHVVSLIQSGTARISF